MNALTSYADAAMAKKRLDEFKAAKLDLERNAEQFSADSLAIRKQYLNSNITELEQLIADFNEQRGSQI